MADGIATYDGAAVAKYLEGRQQLAERTAAAVDRAKVLFQDAIALDKAYAPAHAGLADAFSVMAVYGYMARTPAYQQAMAEAQEAIRLQPDLAEAHASLGCVRQALWDRPGAETSFREALRLNPDAAQTHHWYSIYLTQQGNFAAALAEVDAALRIDPGSRAARAQRASVHALSGNPLAVDEFVALQDVYPHFAYRALVQVHMHANRLIEADAALAQALRYAPPYDRDLKEDEACLRIKQRDFKKATAIVEQLETMWTNGDDTVANNVGAIYAVWGNVSAALSWLDRADAVNDPDLAYLKVDPKWAPLHNEQRYKNILVKRGL